MIPTDLRITYLLVQCLLLLTCSNHYNPLPPTENYRTNHLYLQKLVYLLFSNSKVK